MTGGIYLSEAATLCVEIIIFSLTYLDDTVTTLLISIKFYTTFNVKMKVLIIKKRLILMIYGKTTDPQQSCTWQCLNCKHDYNQ